MASSKVGFVLALIGGILGIVVGIALAVLGWLIFPIINRLPDANVVGLGIYWIISSILVIVGGVWMKNTEKCLKGGILALIFSIVSGGNIFGIVGGITGIIASRKPDVPIPKPKKSK